MSVILGDTVIEPIVASWESAIDCHIRDFLSNRDNVWKVVGLDIERTFLEDSHETEDRREGSRWSNKNMNERNVAVADSEMKSRVAILQLCDGVTCLIIQLPGLNFMPNSLLNFLQLPDFTFVGIGIKDTVAKLEREHGLGCKNAVELGQLAAGVMQMPHLAACGLDVLANMVEPLRLEKPTSVVFSDWGKQILNKKQIKFAAANVFAYFKIGTKLVSGQISN
ncbi:hypothetical protein V6N13_020653 [Hibiscus sabdariffa]|uniref:3'-5' exonuclease domain-containing protein n=1 Tax=Hibiscus sabdariffa TaxID=183260 RepID=A0ABR2EU40_9ROSI